MGWTVWYQVVRHEPLTDAEVGALVAIAAATDKQRWDGEGFGLGLARHPGPDGVVATGMSKLASRRGTAEVTQMGEAINAVLAAIPGGALRLHCDLGVLGVRDGRCAVGGPEGEAPVGVPHDGFVAARGLIERTLPAALENLLALIDAGTPPPAAKLDAKVVKAAYTALDGLTWEHPDRERLCALLRRVPVMVLAEAGMKAFPTVQKTAGDDIFYDAFDTIEDVAPLVPGFLALWKRWGGPYWWRDMRFRPSTRDRLARDPRVLEHMRGNLAAIDAEAKEIVCRRAGHAAEYLVRSRDPVALAALVAFLRRWRGPAVPDRIRNHACDQVLDAVAASWDRRVYATLRLELEHMRIPHRRADVVIAMVRLDSERTYDLIDRMIARAGGIEETPRVVAAVGGAWAASRMAKLAELPSPKIRERVVAACKDAGLPVPTPSPIPLPEELLANPFVGVRARALDALLATPDRRLAVSLMWAEALHRAIVERDQLAVGAQSWSAWADIVPEEIRAATPQQRLAWATGEGAEVLGPQVALPVLTEVRAAGLPAALAAYPKWSFVLDDGERAALLAEEDALIGLR